MKNGKMLTPGKVATMCSVSSRTVCRWIDDGLLKGHRLPGSLHRRCSRKDVVAFAKVNNLPLGEGK